MRTHKNQRAGFTLIELLVVIAIISILASILFPVFARARENARRTSCLSNLKQIGIGLMQYTQDYDERYPRAWCGGNTTTDIGDCEIKTGDTPSGYFNVKQNNSEGSTTHYETWMDYIFPYVKSVQIFICPSSAPPVVANKPNPNYSYSTALSNFGNRDAKFGSTSSVAWVPLSMAAVQRPSEVLAVMEYTYAISYAVDPNVMYLALVNQNNNSFTPHLSGGNLAYADGHAKWISRGAMLERLGGVSPTANCDLTKANTTQKQYAYCSPLWNPFLN